MHHQRRVLTLMMLFWIIFHANIVQIWLVVWSIILDLSRGTVAGVSD